MKFPQNFHKRTRTQNNDGESTGRGIVIYKAFRSFPPNTAVEIVENFRGAY